MFRRDERHDSVERRPGPALCAPAPVAPDFVVVDVETACSRVSSICQIGVVGFRAGQEIFAYETLVDPCDDFSPFNTRIHGIRREHVAGQPTFADIHAILDAHMAGRITVAHSFFDKGALSAACRVHARSAIETTWLDSVRVAKRAWPQLSSHRLNVLSHYLGISHKHHDALSDARAAGIVVVRAMEETGIDLAGWLTPAASRSGPAPRPAADGPLTGHRIAILGAARDGNLACMLVRVSLPRLERRRRSSSSRATSLLVASRMQARLTGEQTSFGATGRRSRSWTRKACAIASSRQRRAPRAPAQRPEQQGCHQQTEPDRISRVVQAMKTVTLADGTVIPALGQGTWMMGEDAVRRAEEIAALRAGVAVGMTVIDTAEMYGDGAAETLVGEAVAGMRDDVFLVSKAYPQNASRTRLEHSCDASLARLGTDRLDLYLLHWRGTVPLGETVEAMNRLVDAGKILRWGVSNLDTDDMEELFEAAGAACATDQILYNLTRRGPELDLLPWLGSHGIAMMAYSPVEQGRLLDHETLGALASRRGVSTAQLALAWVLRLPGTVTIPKAGSVAHVHDNRAAADLDLSDDELAELETAFPRPAEPHALEML